MTIAAQTGDKLPAESRPTRKTRISRDEFHMAVAKLFALRSTCLRGQVGCVAVQGKHIVAGGYNGAPSGMPHCTEVGCGGGVKVPNPELTGVRTLSTAPSPTGYYPQFVEEFPNGCTRSIHAEVNLVAFAARHGISLQGATIWSTAGPCLPCAQALVASGIACLYYETPYRLPEGLQLIDRANIKVVQWRNE